MAIGHFQDIPSNEGIVSFDIDLSSSCFQDNINFWRELFDQHKI